MIFYFNGNGTLISQTPERVFQGSNLASTIYFVAPFQKDLQITVNFVLPNGEVFPAAGAELLNLTQGEELNGVQDVNGVNFCVWEIGITNNVTAYSGKVTAQFRVYNAEQIIATYSVDFTVERGVAPVLPATPTDDIYQQILQKLTTIDASKQDELISGKNIKTLAGQDILGAGNIPLKTVNGQSVVGDGDIEIEGTKVLDGTGNSTTQAMSQDATTKELAKKLDVTSFEDATKDFASDSSLNLLEAKLNENVIKNPDYTYIVVNATSLDFSSLANTVEVDWGDGTTGSQGYGGSANNINHTYTDGVKYHLITIKKLEDAQGAWAYAIDTSGIEAYIGTKTENFFNSGAGDPDHYSNLKKVVYAEGLTSVKLPGMVKEPVIIPKSCTALSMMDISAYPSSTIPKIVIQNNKLVTQTDFPYFDYIAKIVVPKEYINAYKTATGWSAYADKIVYEIDSSDLPDLSNYVEKTSSNTFTKSQYIEPDSNAQGWATRKQDSIDNTSYEYGQIRHTLDNIHTILTFLYPDKSGTLALTSDVDAAKAYADSLNVIQVSNTLLGE